MPFCTLAGGSPPAISPASPRRSATACSARCEGAAVVAGAAFAPAAVGVLDGAQPFAGAQDVRFAVAFAGRRQAAQRETGAVDVIHAPAAVPASVRFLVLHQIFHAAPHRRMALVAGGRPPSASSTRPVMSGQVGSSIALWSANGTCSETPSCCRRRTPPSRRPWTASPAASRARAAGGASARRRRCPATRSAPAAPSPCRRCPDRTRWRTRKTSRKARCSAA